MNASDIARLWPEVERELRRFDRFFVRSEPREHLRTYLRGQMSDLQRKSIEPIALQAGTPPRTLQAFLANNVWDEHAMRDAIQRLVAAEHADERAVCVIDDTAHAKKGRCTPGVKRQWCGASGKIDNCTISVHLAYAGAGVRLLLDSELFLPEDWAQDHDRRREARVPADTTHRTKWAIALASVDCAIRNGVRFRWLTFDEGYGQAPEFLFALADRGLRFVAEVPSCFHGWVREPRVMRRNHGCRNGRPRRMPRVFVQDSRVSSVENLFRHSPALRDQAWSTLRVKDTGEGPVVWQAKECRFFLRRGGLPTPEHRLVVARNVLTGEIKYFVSNAPPSTRLEEILAVAFTRWTVERCFEDAKSELGMSHFEVRNWPSLTRHLLLTALGLLVLTRITAKHRPKSRRSHGLPGPHRGGRIAARTVDGTRAASPAPRPHRQAARVLPKAQRPLIGLPSSSSHSNAS